MVNPPQVRWSPGRVGAALLILGMACTPSRTRPGPPSITIQLPVGSTVFSPDTLDFVVIAKDPDGLDSLTVTVFDTTKAFNTDFNTETTASISVLVPAGIGVGNLIKIYARATDITGQQTLDSASVTVIKRSP